MAKGEAAKTNRLLDQNRQRSQDLQTAFEKNLGDAQTRSSNLFGTAESGFENFAGGGGVSPDLAGDVRSSIGGYGQFAAGNDPSSKFYQNLIDTGGFTPQDIQNMQLQGTANVPQFYKNLTDEMARQNTAQGGVSPGFNASTEEAAREASREGQGAALNTSLGISNLVRQGKISGAEGLARNKLAGLGGATGAALSQGGLETGAREFGVGGTAALRGQTPGEVAMYGNEALGAGSQENQNLATRAQYNPNISLGDRLMQGLGAAGGLAGAASGMGFKPFARSLK